VGKFVVEIKSFADGLGEAKGTAINLKATMIQTLSNYQQAYQQSFGELTLKHRKIGETISTIYQQEDSLLMDNLEARIREIVKHELDAELAKYRAPLTQLAEIDMCNTTDCLKSRMVVQQQQINNLQKAFEEISKVIANKMDQIAGLIENYKADSGNIRAVIDKMANRFTNDIADFKYNVLDRIRAMEDMSQPFQLRNYNTTALVPR